MRAFNLKISTSSPANYAEQELLNNTRNADIEEIDRLWMGTI
ncbi:MAG: hypothetical protein ACC707_10165 [Thiohalomonadales bacterium]